MKDTLSTLRKVAPDLLVLWRNSWVGHPQCANASEPLEAPLNASQAGPWRYIMEQNWLARSVAKVQGSPLTLA